MSQTPCYSVYEELQVQKEEQAALERAEQVKHQEKMEKYYLEKSIAENIRHQELQAAKALLPPCCGYCKQELSGGESRCPFCTSFLEWDYCPSCSRETCFEKSVKMVQEIFGGEHADGMVGFCLLCGTDPDEDDY